MKLVFTAWGIAQPKGSTRAFLPKGWTRPVVTSDNPKTKGWQQVVSEAALAAMPSPALMDGPVSLDVTFYLKRPKSLGRKVRPHTTKPDLDKLIRSVKDALTHIVWHDDSQVIAVQAWKFYAAPDELPHAFVDVRDVDIIRAGVGQVPVDRADAIRDGVMSLPHPVCEACKAAVREEA